MSERLIDLADRQVQLLRLLAKGPACLTDLDETDAAHLVILENRGLVEVRREYGGRVGACLTKEGRDLASRAQ